MLCSSRAARRWRHRQIWLHVDQENAPALAMYKSAGYRVVHSDRSWIPPFQKRHLMCKEVPQRQQHSSLALQHAGEVSFVNGQWVLKTHEQPADVSA